MQTNDNTVSTSVTRACAHCGTVFTKCRSRSGPYCSRACYFAHIRANPAPLNPSGICQCGCGEPAQICTYTATDKGRIVGQPLRYARGHAIRKSSRDYTVDPETGCWLWQRGMTTAGYAETRVDGRPAYAHRVIYEQKHGPIPAGMELDHLCRNRRCVNPDHLEPVSHTENMRRSVHTKLTADRVREIRALAGHVSQREIARRFGIDHSTVWHVIHRFNWRDVD